MDPSNELLYAVRQDETDKKTEEGGHAGHRNLLPHGPGRAEHQALSSGPRLRLLVKLQHQEAEQTRGQEGFQQ